MTDESFCNIIRGPLKQYQNLSTKIGEEVLHHSQLVNEAFERQLHFIQISNHFKKPENIDLVQLLTPTSEQINSIQEYREKNHSSKYFNHLSAISESIPALGWITLDDNPVQYIIEMKNTCQFYLNRILHEWKEKDKIHVEWAEAWMKVLNELQLYVSQYHSNGLVWDIQKHGSSIKALKKNIADKDHHEPVISNLTKRQNAEPQSNSRIVADEPPLFAKDGKKWVIKNQRNNRGLIVEDTEVHQSLYIFNCVDTNITVKGKINSITMDSCKKTSIMFDSLVSLIQFINCQSAEMQVLEKVPTICIDKTIGCQMYLGQNSLEADIITSRSAELKISIPNTETNDYIEYSLPEQYKTKIVPGKGISTVAMEIA